MRFLFIGDIVGKPGRQIVCQALPGFVQAEKIDLVIANAENAAAGSGLTPGIYQDLMKAGVHAITMGDHIYKRREIGELFKTQTNLVKPANYPAEAPGRDHALITVGEVPVAVISLLGRVFMRPVDCPFKAVDRVLSSLPKAVRTIVVDIHAEATSDKQLLARYLDGRVTAVLGTHTHVPTADEQILPGGTAFQCDVGMTGPYDSILGRRIDRVLETTLTFLPTQFEVAEKDPRLCGALVDCDPATGRAQAIRRVEIREEQAKRLAGKKISGSTSAL